MNRLKLLTIILLTCQLDFAAACVTKEVTTTETYYITDSKTEYKTESYTETESVVVKTTTGKLQLSPSVTWNNAIWWLESMGSADSTYYYGYNLYEDYGQSILEHSRSQIKITITSLAKEQKGSIFVYDLSAIGQIPAMQSVWWEDYYMYKYKEWLTTLQTKMENAPVLGKLDTGFGTTTDQIVFDAKGVKSFAIFANTYILNAITSVELIWADDVIEQRTVTKQRQVPYQVPFQVERKRTVMKPTLVPLWEVILSK